MRCSSVVDVRLLLYLGQWLGALVLGKQVTSEFQSNHKLNKDLWGERHPLEYLTVQTDRLAIAEWNHTC